MRKAFNAAVVWMFLAGVAQNANAAEAVAAHVVGMNHPPANYVVLRAKQKLPITFDLSLQNGDVVIVNDPHATIAIRYVDHRDVSLSQAKSPYTIQSRATKPEVTSNFLLTLWSNVTKASYSGFRSTSARDANISDSASMVALENKPLALLIPGLSDGTAKIAAGQRHLMMQWSGGIAPYRFVLRNAKGDLLCEESAIPTRVLAIRSHTVALPPGRYDVQISDNGNTIVLGSFVAVEGGLPHAAAQAGDDPAETATHDSEVLAEKDDPTLYYEAYLKLYDALGKNWQPAEALASWIAGGARKK